MMDSEGEKMTNLKALGVLFVIILCGSLCIKFLTGLEDENVLKPLKELRKEK